MTERTVVTVRPASRRSWARRWLPDQHGAWAMLAVPFLAGTLLAPRPAPAHAVLFGAWLLGYVAVFHGQQWLRLRRHSRRPGAAARHVRPGLVCGAACAVLALPLAARHPWLLWAGAAAAPFVAVNTYAAWLGRERALWNGLAAVVPACAVLLVTLRLGGGAPADGRRPALACLLYFGGTVPYVKTMIRERNSAPYRRASVACHAVALLLATWLTPWLAVPFTLYLARAALLPGRGLRAPLIGSVELAASALLLTVLLAAA
ncbi:YwiC-like family protein [Streptomyces sp. NBC_00536]|uniref:YwiC-like family protein n=1 Tax=Streptomyces sp. NBC_00536 TaxID=2975769 RepID=UPI002E81E0C3|nr:YwiC-like family protein [Streptomyces sp. NBC_00536]WUC81150.1 YwiC-like family protein [Streptomyces sp. NBC_00536]